MVSKKLKRIAQHKERIRFRDPVTASQVVNTLNEYDIGIFILEGVNFNYTYALPNKLFEFIQARLAAAIGPSLEMAKIVKNYDCGIIAQDFSPKTMAEALNRLTKEKIDYYKEQSDKTAHILSSIENCKKLHSIISELLRN